MQQTLKTEYSRKHMKQLREARRSQGLFERPVELHADDWAQIDSVKKALGLKSRSEVFKLILRELSPSQLMTVNIGENRF